MMILWVHNKSQFLEQAAGEHSTDIHRRCCHILDIEDCLKKVAVISLISAD